MPFGKPLTQIRGPPEQTPTRIRPIPSTQSQRRWLSGRTRSVIAYELLAGLVGAPQFVSYRVGTSCGNDLGVRLFEDMAQHRVGWARYPKSAMLRSMLRSLVGCLPVGILAYLTSASLSALAIGGPAAHRNVGSNALHDILSVHRGHLEYGSRL